MANELVGKCGLYCGACAIYRAERDSPQWRAKIAANCECSPEQVRCNGCGNLSPECWGNGCKIVQCSKEKGLNYCYECPEYDADSCEKFRGLADGYLEDGIALRENLLRIKGGKIREWLQESQTKFTCSICGKPLAVGSISCHHCGAEIKKDLQGTGS